MSERFGVRTFWLTVVALALLLPLKPEPLRAQGQRFEGTLTIRWGDPRFRGTAGAIKYVLETADGRYLPVEVTQNANEVLRLQGHRVVVNGRMASRPAVAGTGDADTIVADSIADDARAQAAAGDTLLADPTSGTKKVLFLLLKYADDSGTPHSPGFFLNLTNPDPSSDPTIPTTINQFFKKVSNNTFSWIGDVGGTGGIGAPGGYLILPQPKSSYANCNFSISCFNMTRFDTDAVAVAKAAGINFVINNDLDCCAWGGRVSIDGKTYGATWEPPWAQNTSTYSHEMGHSLGLRHSGWVYEAYDSPWDTMSDIQVASQKICGSYFSRNNSPPATFSLLCDEPGDGYIAGHRDFLGWIPAANQVSINYDTSGQTVTLEGNAVPLTSGVKLIKICLPGYPCTGTGPATRYFTVEARVKNGGTTTQYDNAIPADGVIIHDFYFGRGAISGACFFNDQSGWAVPIDATPGDYTPCGGGRGLSNAQFDVGQTYTNSTYGFKVTVVSRSGNSFVVNVQTTKPFVDLDTPREGYVLTSSFEISGWALDLGSPTGTGVDAVLFFVFPNNGTSPGVFMGNGSYGLSRPDVAAFFGASRFTNSGFHFSITGLGPGAYLLGVYARSTVTGAYTVIKQIHFTVNANQLMAINPPDAEAVISGNIFNVDGWSIDRSVESTANPGTGVDTLHVYAYPNPGSGAPPIFLGVATYGLSRPDVAMYYGGGGPRYVPSGYHLSVDRAALGLTPGVYSIAVVSHSTVTGTFNNLAVVRVTLQ